MPDINEIMDLLCWHKTEAEQQKGRELARTVKCISAFFQPAEVDRIGGKSTWDNCALILSERSDEQLTPYIGDMLYWLQDMNWPGAEIILDRLRRFQSSRELLAEQIRQLADRLIDAEDTGWMFGILWLLEDGGALAQAVGAEPYQRLRAAYEKAED